MNKQPLTDKFTQAISTQRSQLRSVPGSLTLKWSFRFDFDYSKGVYEAFICVVGGNAKVKAQLISPCYTEIIERDFFDGIEQKVHHYPKNNGNYNVTCAVEITPHEIPLETVSLFEFIDDTKPQCWDTKIIIGKAEIKIHRVFLTMISPVFHAMFKHESKELQTGIIRITDFTEEVVRNCFDVCFGKPLENPTTTQIIDMLKFCDKYEITCATTKLENWLKQSFTVENFSLIAAYAWQFSRDVLKDKCGFMFFNCFKELAFDPNVIGLGPEIYSELAKAAAKNVPTVT